MMLKWKILYLDITESKLYLLRYSNLDIQRSFLKFIYRYVQISSCTDTWRCEKWWYIRQ